LLEAFYRRYGCELIHPADGYFYLLPTGDKLGRRHLSVPEMLVGQALTLLYLDPATLQSGGVIKRADALSHLAAVMGSDALTRAFNPKRKRVDERVGGRGSPAEALEKLVARGELVLGDGQLDVDEDGEFSEDSAEDDDSASPTPEAFEFPSEVLSEFEDFGEPVSPPPPAPASEFEDFAESLALPRSPESDLEEALPGQPLPDPPEDEA